MRHGRAIKEFVIEQYLPDTSTDDLDDGYDLVAGGVIDSLGVLKLIAWLEESFGIRAEDVELDPADFRSVAAIAAFVEAATVAQQEVP